MTYKKTSSLTKQQIRPNLVVVILSIIICLTNHQAIYAAAEESTKNLPEKNNSLLISTEHPDMPAEKDFDKIRGYESYDPLTNTWSPIEAFKEVEILEDITQTRDENYLYYSFWAYDPMDHQWKRVDIREYGYKHAKHPSDSDQAMTKKPKKKFEFWKNVGLSFATGGGLTYYINTVNDLNLLVRKGQKEYLLQAPGSTDAAQGKAYKIRWFALDVLKLNSLIHNNVVDTKKSYDEVKGDISFHGIGFNIPITLGLHYTFFKKLRIGVASNLEVNYVSKLYPQGAAANIMEYETPDPWFYNWKSLATIGYKVFQKGKHAVFVDTQLGIVWDFGENWNPFTDYLHVNFYGSLGGAHEIRLNDFCKFFYRLSGQYKRYHNASSFTSVVDNKPSTSSITLWQPAIQLEIGTILNFGRNKESEEGDEDESSPLTPNEPVQEIDSGNSTAAKEEPANKNQNTEQAPGKLLQGAEKGLSTAEQAKSKAKIDTKRVERLFK